MKKKKKKTGVVKDEVAKKVVLVAILGTAPAVLTEAVWAFAQNEHVVPDQVVVMTTATGKRKLKELVFDSGVWDGLKQALVAQGHDLTDKLVFNLDSDRYLMAFVDEKTGAFIEDLPTRAANLFAANQMLEKIRGFAEDRTCRILGLMAGGRKTMTGLFFSVMSLLARRGDKLYHVLVSEPFENPRLTPPFFYPQAGVEHKLEQQSYASTDAQVNLFDVPFVCIGEWAEQKCKAIGRKLTYENLIQSVEKSVDDALTPKIEIDLEGNGRVLVDGKSAKLDKNELVALTFLAREGTDAAALKAIREFAEYLDDAGENACDECACVWLQRFVKSQQFCDPAETDETRWQRKLSANFARLKNRLKGKLLACSPWFEVDGSLRLPPYKLMVVLHPEALHPKVADRLLKG